MQGALVLVVMGLQLLFVLLIVAEEVHLRRVIQRWQLEALRAPSLACLLEAGERQNPGDRLYRGHG